MVTAISKLTKTHTAKTGGEREAIIFIPGLENRWDDPSIEAVARRIATAIDRQSDSGEAKVSVEVADQEYGTGYKCKMFTITKSDGRTKQTVIDVFGLDYNDTLVERYAKRNIFVKVVLLVLTLLITAPRLLSPWNKKGKSVMEQSQLIIGLLLFSLLVLYLVILLAAVVSSVELLTNRAAGKQTSVTAQGITTGSQSEQRTAMVQQMPQSRLPAITAEASRTRIERAVATVWTIIKAPWILLKRYRDVFPPIIVIMTALGFALPKNADLKQIISAAATDYLCTIHYLMWGERTNTIGGKLESLIECLVEREKKYGKIHIIGFSFGSIVAIDNLFPVGRKPTERFERIDTLVTIGCPFDIIRTYWPDYFKHRQTLTDPMRWINVYSPIDVLSSNFANSGNHQPEAKATEGIMIDGKKQKPENIFFSPGSYRRLGLLDILTLMGFRAHSMYWDEEFKGEITCFHDIVSKMYQESSVLH